MPRLTIGMPVYNCECFISEVLDCLLAQTFRKFELIISDNASSDRTEAICLAYANTDSRIKYVRHEVNVGATKNYNFVANLAGTQYFKWHSSNDLLSPAALELCVARLDSAPDVVLAYPETRCFENSVADSVRYPDDPVADQSCPLDRFFHIIDTMHLNNIMNGVLRLDVLRQTTMLREFFYADRNMMAELALRGKMMEEQGCTFYRRMNSASATQKKTAEEVLKHFDPTWERHPFLTTWQIFRGYWDAVLRAKLDCRSTIKGLFGVARRAWWQRIALSSELADFVRHKAKGSRDNTKTRRND